jgi:hypothetical protein
MYIAVSEDRRHNIKKYRSVCMYICNDAFVAMHIFFGGGARHSWPLFVFSRHNSNRKLVMKAAAFQCKRHGLQNEDHVLIAL